MEWYRRWKLLKGQAVAAELLEVVLSLARYLKWTVQVTSVDCLWLAKRLCLGLVEKLEAVQALEEPL